MGIDETTIIVVAVIIVTIFIIIIFITCYCLYSFWKKNRELVSEHKKEEQPLNNGMEDKENANNNNHSTNHNNNNPMNDIAMGGPHMVPHMLPNNANNAANTPYSQEETMPSNGGSSQAKWDGYDVNFLVHPEQYQSTSQASNSGNGSNGKYTPKHMNMNHPHPLNTATVTTSHSLSGPRQPPMPSASNKKGTIPPHVRELHRKRQEQKHKLHAIVSNPNARNKLQLIDSKHISFEYEVGRGKFGKVFRALWTDTNTKQQKTVAVKWFKQDEVDQEVFSDFLKEISVAAHLPPHENVLQIYGFCISPYALVTEYVNGGSVEICVSSSSAASVRSEVRIGDIVQMFIDTARGISHLHTVNIIHRDVAARNLLIEDIVNAGIHTISESDYSVSRRVVVCDFGLSRITQNPDSDNVTNSHIGPLKWMSPESIRQQIYNSKTDVYSFGVVMWEVLCGMPPYPHTKVLSLAVEVISKQTRPYILSWFPRPLQILMQRCWQEIPEFRPTFEDIKNELEMFKKVLIDNNSWNDKLITFTANHLREERKTKEKQRSLHDLVNHYLNPNKYHWDRLIRPKLIKLIIDYDSIHRPRPLPLMNNLSEPQYDDIDSDNTMAVVQQMNVSNKRIQINTSDSLSVHSIKNNIHLNTNINHRLGDSVQIDVDQM